MNASMLLNFFLNNIFQQDAPSIEYTIKIEYILELLI
jgi:hypothetical protein